MLALNQLLKKQNNQIYRTVKVGKVLYLNYLLIKKDEIKLSFFIGLCTSIRKKSGTVTLKNTIKKEKISLIVQVGSPLIENVSLFKRYRRKYRLNKLYFR